MSKTRHTPQSVHARLLELGFCEFEPHKDGSITWGEPCGTDESDRLKAWIRRNRAEFHTFLKSLPKVGN